MCCVICTSCITQCVYCKCVNYVRASLLGTREGTILKHAQQNEKYEKTTIFNVQKQSALTHLNLYLLLRSILGQASGISCHGQACPMVGCHFFLLCSRQYCASKVLTQPSEGWVKFQSPATCAHAFAHLYANVSVNMCVCDQVDL